MSMQEQATFEDISTEYKAFVAKFKPKKTTDDCYTPENIYNAVADWACAKYGFTREQIVRPFGPGGDYERFDYPPGCVVLDNPPFSILSKICTFYAVRGIHYFLFAPGLTLFNRATEANYIVADANITFENGAVVRCGFITDLGEWLVECCPDLFQTIKAIDDSNRKGSAKHLPKYEYPAAILTASKCQWFTCHNIPFRLRREDAAFVRKIDAEPNKGIFGGAFLLSEKAAAEKAAAEKAAAEKAAAERAAAEKAAAERVHKFSLSPRELEIQRMLRMFEGEDHD